MIKRYLRFRRAPIVAGLAALAVFPLVMFLCRLHWTDIGYAVGVYSFVMAVCALVDYRNFLLRIAELRAIADRLSDVRHDFPEPRNEVERAYQEIIDGLYRLSRDERSALIAESADRIDYYTRWLHQIKTPISALRLLFSNAPQTDPLCGQELFKIEQYVEMALQYAKMSELSSDLVLVPCALDEIVLGSIRKYATLFIGKGLGVDFERTGVSLTTDAKWLAFIIDQLLSNAAKYTAKGGVRITGDDKTLTLRDSGIGIRAEDTARIFERGYTGYNGRLDKRASGLGLYMADQTARALDITLSVESAPGEGTAVTLHFGEGCAASKDGDLTKL